MLFRSDAPPKSERDLLPLSVPGVERTRELLLTVCSAAQTEAETFQRLGHFPEAVAEDMEGFGVALACRLQGLPLTIVRGVSNRAGDRRVSQWAITPALVAAAELLHDVLSSHVQSEV